jgi:RND superfamily putative drug exporter
MLERLASACFRHRWRVVALWAVGLVGLLALSSTLGGAFSESGRLEGTDSQRAYDLLGDEMPDRSGESATVVFHHPDGVDRPEASAAISSYLDDVRTLGRVASVSSPIDSAAQISADRSVAFAAVDFTPEGDVPL